MARTPKYRTADDLLGNCTIRNDCFLWPRGSSHAVPTLSPVSPLAQTFFTTSIPRILFTICRHIPSKGRLVHCCGEDYCINPYHYVEASAVRKKRISVGGHPNALLPEQEASRDKLAPPDEEILKLKPVNPVFTSLLANSAVTTGLDGRGVIGTDGRFRKFGQEPRYADKPIFKVSRGIREVPPPKTPEQIEKERQEDEDLFSGAYYERLLEAKRARQSADLSVPEWASKTRKGS